MPLLRKCPTDSKRIKLALFTSVYSYLSSGKSRQVTLTSIPTAALNTLKSTGPIKTHIPFEAVSKR
jgi:hypothetical protein